MNRLEIINTLQNLTDDNLLIFKIGDDIISNRFDFQESKHKENEEYYIKVASILFAYMASLVIYKAQGKEKSKHAYEIFSDRFENIIKNVDEDFNLKIVKDEAMHTIDDFLNSNKSLSSVEMMKKISNMCLFEVIAHNLDKRRKITHNFKRNEGTIYNLVTLFLRSLYHSFLSRKDIDASEISLDEENLANGIIFYKEKEIIIPSWENAFTLLDYKRIAKDGILQVSSSSLLDEVDEISLLYLTKDFIVSFKF